MSESNDNKSVSLYLALFLISVASLTSEILLIRITSLVFFIGFLVYSTRKKRGKEALSDG